jgi:hypothetical protein
MVYPLTELDIQHLNQLEQFWVDGTTRLIGTLPPSCEVKYY